MKLPKLGDSISDATIVKMHKSKILNLIKYFSYLL